MLKSYITTRFFQSYLIVAFLTFITITGCGPANTHEVRFKLIPSTNETLNADEWDQMELAIKERMDRYGYDGQVEKKEDHFFVCIPIADTNDIYKVSAKVTPPYGHFELLELTNFVEIYNGLLAYNDSLYVQEKLSVDSSMYRTSTNETSENQDTSAINVSRLFKLMSIQGMEDGRLIMTVKEHLADSLLTLLNQGAGNFFPENTQFMLGGLPVKNEFGLSIKANDDSRIYNVYAVKMAKPGAFSYDGHIIKASTKYLPQGRHLVTIEFDKPASEHWSKMTEAMSVDPDNDPRFVAIIYDQQVYGAPRVSAQIPNGKTQITGNFSEEEAHDLAGMINTPHVPYALLIRDRVIKPLN